MKFKNLSEPSREFSIEEVMGKFLDFINEAPEQRYRIIVGTDSLHRTRRTSFSTAIIIHRVGKSARFFYSKYFIDKFPRDIVPRIMREVQDSIDIITKLQDSDLMFFIDTEDWEVHVDAGQNGESIKVVHQALAYVNAMGFKGEAKPDAAIATNVADRFTGHN